MFCEDYPSCGHTRQDPCAPQWYDRPGAFDTSIPGNEHALCDHENGFCDVDDELSDDDEDEAVYCRHCGSEDHLTIQHQNTPWGML